MIVILPVSLQFRVTDEHLPRGSELLLLNLDTLSSLSTETVPPGLYSPEETNVLDEDWSR